MLCVCHLQHPGAEVARLHAMQEAQGDCILSTCCALRAGASMHTIARRARRQMHVCHVHHKRLPNRLLSAMVMPRGSMLMWSNLNRDKTAVVLLWRASLDSTSQMTAITALHTQDWDASPDALQAFAGCIAPLTQLQKQDFYVMSCELIVQTLLTVDSFPSTKTPLAASLHQQPSLRKRRMVRHYAAAPDLSAWKLSAALGSISSLRHLQLSYGDLTLELCGAIAHCKALQQLACTDVDIGKVSQGADCIKAVVAAVVQLAELQDLTLTSAQLGTADALRVAASLPKLQHLIRLDLRGN